MALSPGEQALVAKGQPVTSSFIPAESRARINAAIQSQQSSAPVAPPMAPPVSVSRPTGTPPAPTGGMLTSGQTGTPVANMPSLPTLDSTTVSAPNSSGLIQQIYERELGRSLGSVAADEGALDYWTSRLQSGASAEQIRREIEGSPEGIAFDVSSAYTGLLGRPEAEIDPEGQQYWTQQLQTGALTPEQMQTSFLQSEEFLGDIGTVRQQNPLLAMQGAVQTGSIADLGSLFYQARKAGDKIPAEIIEEIAKSRTPDIETGFNFAVGGQAYAEGLEALDQAIQSGDVNKAQEIRNALADEQGFFDYYLQNIADDIGQAQGNLRKETATGDVFDIGDPGKYQRSFFDKIGDTISDTIQNPYVQAFTAFIPGVGPAVSSVLQAWGTLDSGENLSPTQIIAAVTGVSELSNLEGGNLLASLPPQIRETATAIQKALEGGWDEAFAALKDAGLDATSEQLAAFEDAIRATIGDENIEAISGGFANFEDAARDLFEGQFGGIESRLGGLEELLAGLAAERGGAGFTPQRGYQPGLPVDTQFDADGRSLVLEILNQPSSVQRTA